MRNVLILALLCNIVLPLKAQKQTGIDTVKLYLLQNQYSTAIEYIQKNHSSENSYYRYLALSYKNLYNYSQALVYYQRALESDSLNFLLNFEIANTYKQADLTDKALLFFKKADRINSTVITKAEIAALLVNNNSIKEALALYANLHLHDSINLFFIRNMARCYEQLNNTDSAIFFYSKILDINKLEAFAVNKLANLYIRNKEYNKSLTLSNAFIKIDSTNSFINRVNAYGYVFLKQYDTAIVRFQTCIRHADTSAFVYKFLGISYYKTEDYESAINYLERSYWQDSSDAKATYFLGLACANTYYKQKGIYYLNKTLSLVCPADQELADLYKNVALANRGFYRDEVALKYYLRAQSIMPTDPLLIFSIAELYDDFIRDKKTALKYYQQFMTTRPKKTADESQVVKGTKTMSYYDLVENRIQTIQEEIKRNN